MQAIQFDNVNCYYKHKKNFVCALKNINLSVPQGQFLVVVGESGSGKSTLIKSCMGLVNFFEGNIYVGGVAVEKIETQTANYGYVSQEIGLAPNLTVFENIAFPLENIKTAYDEIERRVEEIAQKLDVKFLLTRKPHQLSGGQQQRVAIAKALVKNPSFMFFDEPFANLEPHLRVELRQLVKTLAKQYCITTVFVTHDIAEAFAVADRIVVLENGQIAESGTPAELKTSHSSSLLKAYFDGVVGEEK